MLSFDKHFFSALSHNLLLPNLKHILFLLLEFTESSQFLYLSVWVRSFLYEEFHAFQKRLHNLRVHPFLGQLLFCVVRKMLNECVWIILLITES